MVLVSLLLATAAFSFWLWLVILPVKVTILCPEECTCDTAGYSIRSSSNSLIAVPSIHLTDVRELWLSNNNITLLEKDSFVSMTELKLLDLTKCELRTIELGAFNGLTELTHLFMWDNKISEIMPGTFENMDSLEFLALNYNKIKHLNNATFSGLGAFKGLTKLTRLLVFRNEISEILPGTFENMISLEYLFLGHNNIKYLNSGVFNGLVNIVYVGLSSNKLQYMHPDTILGLPNIKSLNLRNNTALQIPTDSHFINSHFLTQLELAMCNISSLSVETFANVSALKSLDLSHNNLRTVDINILRALPELSQMYLYGNPLQCDCQLQEVWRRFEDRNIQTVYWVWVPECDTPSEVEGLWWGVLEKLQCLEGNIDYFGDYNKTSYIKTDTRKQEYEYENKDDVKIFKQYQVPVYAVAFIFGTTGNVILILIMICNKDMRTVHNIHILNLAISDIIYLTVFLAESCENRINGIWIDNEIKCEFFPFCRRMSVGLSAYSVALYSFQRYRVTVSPFQVRVSSHPKWCVILATLAGVWIVAALFAVPSRLSKYLCQITFPFTSITYYQHVVMFELLVSCVLPLCVIAFSYIMTARHLVQSSRGISEGTQNPQLKTRRNAAKIVVGLTVVFVISYVPYHVLWTYFICSLDYPFSPIFINEHILYSKIEYSLHSLDYNTRYTYIISTCFLLINSCLNPVALFCTSSLFRQHLKRHLTCFCKTTTPTADFELARRN